ncbi:MAG: hypothetical protein UIM25_07820 [Bacteroidales bacterium]|nr:hypothetical protein [Bacteroidales bacterium]
MKLRNILIIIVACLCLVSCGEYKDTKQKKVVYSNNIQDTFFGVKFGESQIDVIKAFKKYNLYSHDNVTDSVLCFLPKDRSKFFDFGGFNWKFVLVHFSSDKFYKISFFYSANSASAMKRLSELYKEVSQKYNMIDETTEDFMRYVALSEDGKKMEISLPRLLGSEDVMLKYCDEKLTYEARDKAKAKAKSEL